PVPPLYTVSGNVTRNGANPSATYCAYSTYGIRLDYTRTTDSRYDQTYYTTCNTSGAAWTFSTQLYPGTYKVTAQRYSSNTDNLPSWSTVVSTSFTVSGGQSGVSFDIPVPAQYAVSGKVTRNGSNPSATYCAYSTYGIRLD